MKSYNAEFCKRTKENTETANFFNDDRVHNFFKPV